MQVSIVVRLGLIVAIAALSPRSARAEEKPTVHPRRTVIGDTPWSPSARPDNKVIYGNDDRRDVFEEPDETRRALADSICALIDVSRLTDTGDGAYTLRPSAYQVSGVTACSGEPFANQPTAAYCTGFMVGPDLIATAGHCFEESDLAFTRFLFGFRMENANTARTVFDDSEVYTGIEIVARQLEGGFDYAIIRVDRDIAAPGAQVLSLRTAGTIAPGTQVGLIGHPAGLPTKIAFGETTVVRESTSPGYFVANLDAYGGNSGSPVFNADTGVVEGILVRGESDFELESDCFRSRNLANSGGLGEDVSKAVTFARFVQLRRGTVSLDKSYYACDDTIMISLFDHDLQGAETAKVRLLTSGADSETIVLEATERFATFEGNIGLSSDPPASENGVVEAMEGMSLYLTYRDANIGNGAPGDAVATARVDCSPPVISDVQVLDAGGNNVQITFTTDEPAAGSVMAGTACGATTFIGEGGLTTEHLITVRNLAMETNYRFFVMATDAAGNSASDDNSGECYPFTTTDELDYLTETFFDGTSDLTGLTATFRPDGSASGYSVCLTETSTLPTSPICGVALSLGDDDTDEYILQRGRQFSFFDRQYSAFFVGSNGYITFGRGDTAYVPTLATHFDLPRISAYFSDLYPPAGGVVNVTETEDRVAITYYDVIDIFGGSQRFQVEIFYDGVIRITWMVQTLPYGIVGLSRGGGLPQAFEASDLSTYLTCANNPYENIICENGLPNDDCADALPISVGETMTGSTAFALGSNNVPGCESCFSQDTWYTFTPETSGLYTLSLCDSRFDTVLELYGGTCGALSFIDANDDSFCGYQSRLQSQLTAGETYRIRVTGYSGASGTYSLTVTPGGKAFGGCYGETTINGDPGDLAVLLGTAFLAAWTLRRRSSRRPA